MAWVYDQYNVLIAATAAFSLALVLAVYKRLVSSHIPSLRVEMTAGNDVLLRCKRAAHQNSHAPSVRQTGFPAAEAEDSIDAETYVPRKSPDGRIPCYDPANLQLLGHLPAMSAAEVRLHLLATPGSYRAVRAYLVIVNATAEAFTQLVNAGHTDSTAGAESCTGLSCLTLSSSCSRRKLICLLICRQEWRLTSFSQRKLLLRTILKYTIDNQKTICRYLCEVDSVVSICMTS